MSLNVPPYLSQVSWDSGRSKTIFSTGRFFASSSMGSLLLPGVGFYSKDFLRRFSCLIVLTGFSFVGQTHLVLAQDIGFLLTGLTILGSLSVGEHLVHVLQFPLQFCIFLLQQFYRLGQRTNQLRYFRSCICCFLIRCAHKLHPKKQIYPGIIIP